MLEKYDLIVIGGGAAGFFAAIQAKSIRPDSRVMILEAAAKPLGKVKISGGGRCNVTTSCFDPQRLVQHYPRGERELKGIFSQFGPADTVAWFERHGVALKTEPDGRIFPVSNDSQTIIDCLLKTARDLNIKLLTRQSVKTVQRKDSGFVVLTPEEVFQSQSLLLVTGSNPAGYRIAEAMGHHLIQSVPSLFTFNIQDALLSGLEGISFPTVVARLSIPGQKPIQQEGPLLITHWGLSGPVILRLSAWGARMLHQTNYRGSLTLDFLPQLKQDDLLQQLRAEKEETPKKQIQNAEAFGLPKRFWSRLLSQVDINPETPWKDVPQKNLNRLSEALKRSPFQILGKGPFKEEFVTAGGIPLKEINLKRMESQCCPNLFFAGEIIDVDGLTGGFNFQNAWSTGWIAGNSVGQ